MNIVLDSDAIMPTRAHDFDAGYDLYSRETKTVLPNSSQTFDTGVHVQLPIGTAGLLVSKSGLNVNHDITSTGLIDAGYTGSIVVKLYNNHTKSSYTVNKGDKITQLVVINISTPPVEIVDSLDESERGSNGFGSSGV